MKRYIRASFTPDIDIDYSMFSGTPFKCDTGTSYGNDFLNKKDLAYTQREKNRTGEIVMLSPNEYFRECSQYGFDHYVSVDDLKLQRRASKVENGDSKVETFKDLMQNGTKFDMCYINKADNKQEGLHRMMAAGDLYGWNTKFPVLVITAYDDEVEEENKQLYLYNRFNRYYFDDVCQQAADNIADWYAPVPDNFVDLYRSEIIDVAKTFDDEESFDIDVQVEIANIEGDDVVQVFLTRCGGYKPNATEQPFQILLANMYNINNDHQPSDSSDWDIPDEWLDEFDNMELTDANIEDFFFRHKIDQ